jgi:hypothetical protein
MMPHGSIVNPEERWKIAMYVRVLQLGEGPDALSKLVAKGTNTTIAETESPTELTDRAYQGPAGEAQANKASATPGQGGAIAPNGSGVTHFSGTK